MKVISDVNGIQYRMQRWGNETGATLTTPGRHLNTQEMAAGWNVAWAAAWQRVGGENSNGRQIWGDKARTKRCHQSEMWRKAVKARRKGDMLWSFEGACHDMTNYFSRFLVFWFSGLFAAIIWILTTDHIKNKCAMITRWASSFGSGLVFRANCRTRRGDTAENGAWRQWIDVECSEQDIHL